MTISRSILHGYQWLAGLADTVTGVCLVAFPTLTMKLLGIELSETTIPYVSYIGVFVVGVGISYFLCGRLSDETSQTRWETTWKFTATCRSLVALFLVLQICFGRFPLPWITVALTDGLLACFQWYGLYQGWLRKEGTP